MNVEVLSLAIEKRYFKNFEKSALHNGLYAVIYWCKGEVYMIPMTTLMTTAIDTLEKYNKGYETGRYSTEEIVFQENNPLRGNIDRELHITEDEENEGGYILAMYSNNKEHTAKEECISELQAKLLFRSGFELGIALQVFCSFPLADTLNRPCCSEGTSTHYVYMQSIYERMAQLYSGVCRKLDSRGKKKPDHGWMFVDSQAYLDGELVVTYSDDEICLTTSGCTLRLNPWKYSNSAMEAWLVMFRGFVNKLVEKTETSLG